MSNSQCLFHKGVVYEVSSYTFEYIEGDVARLLRDFEHARQIVVDAPVPIEDIVEKHLKLRVDFDDIHRLLGISRSGLKTEILGAIFPNEAWIVIDESLDPELYPAQEAHYRFTLAHEGGGHWRSPPGFPDNEGNGGDSPRSPLDSRLPFRLAAGAHCSFSISFAR